MKINAGDSVQVSAKVLRHRVAEHIPIEMQSVDLQLPDGQHLQTNARNLLDYSITTPTAERDDAITAQHERKLLQIAESSLRAATEEIATLKLEVQSRDALLDAANASAQKLQEQVKQKDSELRAAAEELVRQRNKPLLGVDLRKKR